MNATMAPPRLAPRVAGLWCHALVASLGLAASQCGPLATAPSPGSTRTGLAPAPAAAERQVSVSPLVPLLPPGPTTLSSAYRERFSLIFYGRGTFFFHDYLNPRKAPPCPIVSEGCSVFSVSSSGSSPDESDWIAGKNRPTNQQEAGLKKLSTTSRWGLFAGGRDAIFALRDNRKTLDRIDDQGQISLFVQSKWEVARDWFEVIEVGQRTLFLGAQGRAPLQLVEAEPSGAGRTMGDIVPLPMGFLPDRLPNFPFEATTREAREMTDRGLLVMVGRPRKFRLADSDKIKDHWAMAWLEVAPSPLGGPRGAPAESRSLDDASVEKKAHLTSFSGTKMLQDEVLWSTRQLDPYSFEMSSIARVDQGKITVLHPPAGPLLPRGRPDAAPDPTRPLAVVADEEVLGAAFDALSGEGAAVVRSGERALSLRFDGAGHPVGEPVPFVGRLDGHALSLVKTQGGWLALRDGETPVVFSLFQPGPSLVFGHPGQLEDVSEAGGQLAFFVRERGGPGLWKHTFSAGGEETREPALASPTDRLEIAPGRRAGSEWLSALADDPVSGPLISDLRRSCPAALKTGPATAALVCAYATDPLSPGVRVGLRLLRRGP